MVRQLAIALVAVLMATVAGGASARDAVAGSSCVDGWQPMPLSAQLAGAIPYGSASLAGQPAWLVGRANARAVIGRWDGAAWQKVAAPWTIDSALAAVSPLEASKAWAVGLRRLHSPRAVAAKWNGTAWKEVLVPHPGGRAATFTDVVALGKKRAFAVGMQLRAGRLVPWATFKTTAGWATRNPDFGTADEGALTAAASSMDGKLWAAGWRSSAGAAAPWIGYWDGAAWVETAPVLPTAGLGFITELAFDAAGGWAVGYVERETGGYAPLLERWDGSTWQVEPLPFTADESVVLTSVAIGHDGVLVVGGQEIRDAGPSAVIATKAGATWAVTAPRDDPYPGSWMLDASDLSSGAMTVGFIGPALRALVSCAEPTPPPPPGSPNVNGEPPDGGHERFIEDVDLDRADGTSSLLTPEALEGFIAIDVTDAAGLTLKTMSYGGVVADFNDDDFPDVFINRHGEAVPRLMLGTGTGFTPAVDPTFQFTDRHQCAVADATGEGEPDMFCAVGRRQGTAMGVHEFYVNVGANGGTLSTTEFGLSDVTGRGRNAAFVHLETEAYPALFIGNEPVRMDALPSFNRFYRDVDGTHFVPAPQFGLDTSQGTVCALAANVDADADDELLICTSESTGSSAAAGAASASLTAMLGEGLRLYDFDGSHFVDRTAELGLGAMATLDVAVADFNADSLPDIVQISPAKVRVSVGTGDGFARAYELAVKKNVAVAVGDVNADARTDIYVSRSSLDGRAHLMLVNDGDGTSFTSVAIPQPGGSADDVLAIDYDANGLTDFITLNGFSKPGNVKLTAFFADP